MKSEMYHFIKKHMMLHPGDRVVVGVSGGADSVCLLHLLWCLKDQLEIEIRAVHVHHGLRGEEADRDADFTGAFCASLHVPCEIVRIHAAKEAREQRVSVEEAGRNARYRILEEKAKGWEDEFCDKQAAKTAAVKTAAVKIAVAHHGNDNAETILHNLFRGSGLKGLSGIPAVRGRIIRPLLWAEREDILTYLKERGLLYMEDSTNAESDYTRNRLRNRILPLITSGINERAVQHILHAGGMIGDADRYLDKIAGEWLENRSGEGEGRLPIPALKEEEAIIQTYIIRRALQDMGCPLKDVTAGHVEDILSLLSKQTGKQVNLPHGILARRRYDSLELTRGTPGKETPGKNPPGKNPPQVSLRVLPSMNQQEIPKNGYTKWFDYGRIVDALSVRTRQTGDYITLAGGKKKTVKAFMIDEKIPAGERDGIPLLAERNHILWIIGYRISEYYKVTEHTEHILEVQLDGGTDGAGQD